MHMRKKTLMTLVGTTDRTGREFRFHLRDNISRKGLEGLFRKTDSVDIDKLVFPDGTETELRYMLDLFLAMQNALTPSPERDEFFMFALREAINDKMAWKVLEKMARIIESKSPDDHHPGDVVVMKLLGKLQ
jgi:hypothetical protein